MILVILIIKFIKQLKIKIFNRAKELEVQLFLMKLDLHRNQIKVSKECPVREVKIEWSGQVQQLCMDRLAGLYKLSFQKRNLEINLDFFIAKIN
jgi:hypothetical protein